MAQETPKRPELLHRVTLVVVAIGVSLFFLYMISDYLMALLLAAVLSGWCYPLFLHLTARLRGSKVLGASATVLLVFLLVIIPLLGFFTMVGFQTVQLAQDARPWIEDKIAGGADLDAFGDSTVMKAIEPYRDQIVEKVGGMAGNVGALAAAAVKAAAEGTLRFFLDLFVMLYAMFFFLLSGRALLERILFYLPLPSNEEDQMIARFVSVTRATIKGTIIIGLVQGALGGLGFWVAGIKGVAVWATVMGILSAVPPFGSTIVWIPAVIYLAIVGKWWMSAALFAWCAIVVGAVDNFLRPVIVGRDTKLPDLLVLISTLGGLVLFGATGVVIGPIIAALFVTVWELYGTAFAGFLPPRAGILIANDGAGLGDIDMEEGKDAMP